MMYQKKFAVVKVLQNKEIILKFFKEDEKEAAKAYGAEVAKTNTQGLITCILAWFDEDNHTRSRECAVFEVWE